ncbi:hypothetical protein C1I64_03950 [Rathayibacter festucae DSM 15932]|uniref:Uncharacterized protein n=1 Tax=Rathayibacter festucae DSM 15932 TaxID=1328866 RepID=A0A3T0SY76_9MICO|nr:hypothetical protein C1I64_03950 [Rathayibacter festucae DSM 15932]
MASESGPPIASAAMSIRRVTLASLPRRVVPRSGQTTRQCSEPTEPLSPRAASRTAAPPDTRSARSRVSPSSATGPTSASSTRPTTAARPPTWSRS